MRKILGYESCPQCRSVLAQPSLLLQSSSKYRRICTVIDLGTANSPSGVACLIPNMSTRYISFSKEKGNHGNWMNVTKKLLISISYAIGFFLVLEVKERLAKDCTSLPIGKNGRDDEEMILWFLKDRRYSVDEAIGKLTKAIKWRHEFKVDELSEDSVKTATDTGKAYAHDFLDVKGRPVVIVAPAKHIPGLLDPVEDEKLCVFILEKALSKLPAGQRKILGIFDLSGFGSQNADLKFLTFLFDVFYYYYPRRLDEVLFVDAPFIFQPIWQFTKPLVKQYASLVKFCSAETVRKEYFTEETLPLNFRS